MDAEFAARIFYHFTHAAAPSVSVPQPSAPISMALAAMCYTPIPPQLETKRDRATLLLERISHQLTKLLASQQDGFQELTFRYDTHDINTMNVGKEAVGDFLNHTRKIMNEVSCCFAGGGLHEPSVEARTKYEDKLYKEVRDTEDAIVTAAKGEKSM